MTEINSISLSVLGITRSVVYNKLNFITISNGRKGIVSKNCYQVKNGHTRSSSWTMFFFCTVLRFDLHNIRNVFHIVKLNIARNVFHNIALLMNINIGITFQPTNWHFGRIFFKKITFVFFSSESPNNQFNNIPRFLYWLCYHDTELWLRPWYYWRLKEME